MCTTIRNVVINSQTVAGRTSLIRPPHIGYQNNAAFFTTHKAQQLTILCLHSQCLSLPYRQIFGLFLQNFLVILGPADETDY